MFKNYLKISYRNIKKHRGFSFIHICGLVIGLSSCMLIISFINYEMSYDKHHENSNRIYRLGINGTIGGTTLTAPISNAPTAAGLREEYPEIIKTVRFKESAETLVKYHENNFIEKDILFTDNSVFEIFSHDMIYGNPGTALLRAYSIVLTENIAKKYF